MDAVTWPTTIINARDHEWIEAARSGLISKHVGARRPVPDTVAFPFGENWSKGLRLAADLLKDYLAAVIALLPFYRNHTIVPEDPADLPQAVNPPWTIETIMDDIGCITLPEPQYDVIDNTLVLLRIKQIIDRLLWPILPDGGPGISLDSVLSWNTYAFACSSYGEFGCYKVIWIGAPPGFPQYCNGWYWSNKTHAEHTDENGDTVVDVDSFAEADPLVRCPEHGSGDDIQNLIPASTECQFNQEDMLADYCPEWSRPGFGMGVIEDGVIWHPAGHSPVWSYQGTKSWTYTSNHPWSGGYYTTAFNGSVSMSRPVVHPERIPANYKLHLFLIYMEDGESVRVGLGAYEHVEPSGDEEITVELPNPFPEFEYIHIPPKPPKFGSSTVSGSQSATVVAVWEYLGQSEA